MGEKPIRRKPKVSWARLILPGLVGPKRRPKGVREGKQVNIPHHGLLFYRRSDAEGYADADRHCRACARSRFPKANPRG